MRTDSVSECINCQKIFVVNRGWNSQYCSKECRDETMKEIEPKEEMK